MKANTAYSFAIIFPIVFFIGLFGFLQTFKIAPQEISDYVPTSNPTDQAAITSPWNKVREISQAKGDNWDTLNPNSPKRPLYLLTALVVIATTTTDSTPASASQMPSNIVDLISMSHEMADAVQAKMLQFPKIFYIPPPQTVEVSLNFKLTFISKDRRYVMIDDKRYRVNQRLDDGKTILKEIHADKVILEIEGKKVPLKLKK